MKQFHSLPKPEDLGFNWPAFADALEREHEERRQAAQALAGMLATSEATAETQAAEGQRGTPRDESEGRFTGGTADAGEHGAPVMPTPNMGVLIMAHIDGNPVYLRDETR